MAETTGQSERWQRQWELFHAAQRKAPAEQEAFLEEACGSDPELGREVRELLAAHEEASSLLDRPAELALEEDEHPSESTGSLKMLEQQEPLLAPGPIS